MISGQLLKWASKNKNTSFSPREKVGMRELKSITYPPHPSPLPEGEGMFRGSLKTFLLASPSIFLTACDPMLSLQGSFWPAWIICILSGLAASMLLMWQLVHYRLAPHLGPPLLIAPSLWALCTFSIWLVFYAA